jgi:hypothetical protein
MAAKSVLNEARSRAPASRRSNGRSANRVMWHRENLKPSNHHRHQLGQNDVVFGRFGGKEVLLGTIYHHLLSKIEVPRVEFLAELKQDGACHHRLMQGPWLPPFQHAGEVEQHSYVAFIMGRAHFNWARMRYSLNQIINWRGISRSECCGALSERCRSRLAERQIILGGVVLNALATINLLAREHADVNSIVADIAGIC